MTNWPKRSQFGPGSAWPRPTPRRQWQSLAAAADQLRLPCPQNYGAAGRTRGQRASPGARGHRRSWCIGARHRRRQPAARRAPAKNPGRPARLRARAPSATPEVGSPGPRLPVRARGYPTRPHNARTPLFSPGVHTPARSTPPRPPPASLSSGGRAQRPTANPQLVAPPSPVIRRSHHHTLSPSPPISAAPAAPSRPGAWGTNPEQPSRGPPLTPPSDAPAPPAGGGCPR
mmetsp:Transcript_18326/g.44119  ORF Transcript_18326/g.44119 Transcript_18326/m.44119 type:complete len:230 (-) Transcript_18326:69-758(-)